MQVLLLLLGCLGAAFGLAGFAAANDDLKLRLEPAAGSSGQLLPLSHPAQAAPEHLASVLSALKYTESGLMRRGTRRSVFDADEVQALAPALAEALASAGPSEQVRFASFNRRSGNLGQMRKTEAVAFIDASGLFNLAFLGIHEFAGPDTDFFAFLELSERNPMALQRSLLSLETTSPSQAGAAFMSQPGRPLWVRAELGAAAASTRAGAAAPEPSRQQPSHQESSYQEPGYQEPSYQAPTITQTPAPSASDEAVDTASSKAVQAGEMEVRQRLEFLKGLYEDGLISAEEYQQKRREALQRLD